MFSRSSANLSIIVLHVFFGIWHCQAFSQSNDNDYLKFLGIWYPTDSAQTEPIFIEVKNNRLVISGVDFNGGQERWLGIPDKNGIYPSILPPFYMALAAIENGQIEYYETEWLSSFQAEIIHFGYYRPTTLAQNLFISAKTRDFLGFDEISEYIFYLEGNTGGMNENGSLIEYILTNEGAERKWNAIYESIPHEIPFPPYIINTDSTRYINGEVYEYENGRMNIRGGVGYGSFTESEYHWISDREAIIIERNTGHASFNQTIHLSILKQTENQHPDTLISFLDGFQEDSLDIDFDTSFENWLFSTYGKIATDTTFYNKQKHLPYQFNYFIPENLLPDFKDVIDVNYFHDIQVERASIKDVVLQKFGFKPKFLIIELYPKAVWILKYETSVDRYFIADSPVLFE